MKYLGPSAYDFAGEWIVRQNSQLWNCVNVSQTEVNCGGHKLLINGETVTWDDHGSKGKILQSGNKTYDTIQWDNGSSDWTKLIN